MNDQTNQQPQPARRAFTAGRPGTCCTCYQPIHPGQSIRPTSTRDAFEHAHHAGTS